MKTIIQEIKLQGVKDWVLSNPKKTKIIEKLIIKCSTAYYEGAALITDEEFEHLINVLRYINPKHKLLTTPGWGYKVKYGSKHLYGKINGLPYYFDYNNLKQELNGISQFIIAPKFDGINFVAYYKNGKLKKCLTRGNGYIGKNITSVFKNYNLNTELQNKTFAINGEAILYEPVNQNINFRDRVAEHLNNKTKEKNIEFIPFMLLNTELTNYLQIINQINKISRVKLQFKQFDFLPSKETLINIFKEYSQIFKIDGLVITDINLKKQVAYKFAKEEL